MKKFGLFILVLILSGFLFSCGTAYNGLGVQGYEDLKYFDDGQLSYGLMDYSPLREADGNKGLIAGTNESFYKLGTETKVRKILFSANLSLTVKNPDTANARIENIAKKYEGYVNQIGTYRTVIRVKSEKLNEALEEISALGRVESKSLTGQDVTEEYLDYQIRLENAEKARGRYLELLAKAENVEAALAVEKELERLNGTIDLIKGKMNRINHLAEFSTITINLKEKKKPGVLGYIGMGVYYSVKWLFVRN
ncbi:MAG: DUF4349 domain-containing protein [Saprospiraceae bacterium]|nr:DUF4349 domain-containing protein [Saprospiraceae bacterium]